MQVHISRDGQCFGPFTPAQITEMLQSGVLDASDSVWIEPHDWQEMSSFSWLFCSRAEAAPKSPDSILRVPGTERRGIPTSPAAAGGLNGLQTNGRNIRPVSACQEEGSENLMKDVFDL